MSFQDAVAYNLFDLIKANARALYGRNRTYDIVTGTTKSTASGPWGTEDKVFAFLIAYDSANASSSPDKGHVMYKACVTGKKKGPKPTTAQAVEALWEMMREMIGKQAERLFAVDYFEGPLIPEEKMRMWKKVGAEADVKSEGADVGKVEDEIDGITLRGD